MKIKRNRRLDNATSTLSAHIYLDRFLNKHLQSILLRLARELIEKSIENIESNFE